jgi:hypothetical protein
MGKGFEAIERAAKAAEQFGETVDDLKTAEIFAVCANGTIFHLRNVEVKGLSAAAVNRDKLVEWLKKTP